MTDSILQFISRLIEKKSRLPKDIDFNSFNYIDSGYVDSIGIMSFLLEIEREFDIEITEAEMETEEFRTIGGLVMLIKDKIASKRGHIPDVGSTSGER